MRIRHSAKKAVLNLLGSATAAIALLTFAQGAEAKQCVWNKAGFVLKLEWYRKDQVVYNADQFNPEKFDYANYRFRGDPVQVDQFPVAQGRCNERSENLWVVARVVGANWANEAIGIAAGTAAAIGGALLTGVACVAAPGAGCVVAGGVAPLVSTAYGAASTALPDPQEIVFVGEPSTTDWIDVWGTIWSPQFGKGGRI
jgi:hypothetical protein